MLRRLYQDAVSHYIGPRKPSSSVVIDRREEGGKKKETMKYFTLSSEWTRYDAAFHQMATSHCTSLNPFTTRRQHAVSYINC